MSHSRTRILLVSLLAVFAVSIVASSSASAFTSCYRVAEKGTGNKDNSCVTDEGGAKNEYITIAALEKELKPGEWCAKVKEATTGNYEDNACTKKVAKKEYIKVKVPTFWLCRKAGTEKYTEHLCKETSGTGEWSYLPVEGTEKYTFEGKSGPSKLESEIAKKRVIIECAHDTITGELEALGRTKKVKIVYEECSLYEVGKYVKTALPECKVPNIETGALNDQLITGKGIGPEDEFEPEGAAFATIVIEGATCSLVSTETVTGRQICQLPEATVGKVEHEIECSPSGGFLAYGGKPASYFGSANIKLTNGWTWGAEP